MQMVFTDGEREWIDDGPGNWRVRDGAPEHVRESLEEKLGQMADFARRFEEEPLRRWKKIAEEQRGA